MASYGNSLAEKEPQRAASVYQVCNRHELVNKPKWGFFFLFEFLFHGVLLRSIYEQTSDVWRPEGEHKLGYLLNESAFLLHNGSFLLYAQLMKAKASEKGCDSGCMWD